MTKFDLLDLTFIIPLRIDYIDRLENLLFSTNLLIENFNTNIIVWESDERNRLILPKLLSSKIKHVFNEDYDPIFYRTKFINTIVKTIQTPYIAIWDADVLVPKEQIIESINALRSCEADFVYPYKDKLLNVPTVVKNIFAKKTDLSILQGLSAGFHVMYGPKPVGGGFFANLAKYIEVGMENENYYGWGIEDGERVTRWMRLNYNIKHVEGALYHLYHSRGVNSTFHTVDQDYIKKKELHRIRTMPQKLLKNEIKEWHKE